MHRSFFSEIKSLNSILILVMSVICSSILGGSIIRTWPIKRATQPVTLEILPSRKFLSSQKVKSLFKNKPAASEVLTCHLEKNGCPPWTSYFVRYDSIVDDQWGRSHFNWPVGEGKHNYHILRTGCYPYIKYHCSKRPHQDLRIEDAFFRFIKVFNLGLPCLAYGIAAIFMIRHEETVVTSKGPITIYFLYAENKGSSF